MLGSTPMSRRIRSSKFANSRRATLRRCHSRSVATIEPRITRQRARGASIGQLGTVAAGWCLAEARGVARCAATGSRSLGAVITGWRPCKSVDMIASLSLRCHYRNKYRCYFSVLFQVSSFPPNHDGLGDGYASYTPPYLSTRVRYFLLGCGNASEPAVIDPVALASPRSDDGRSAGERVRGFGSHHLS